MMDRSYTNDAQRYFCMDALKMKHALHLELLHYTRLEKGSMSEGKKELVLAQLQGPNLLANSPST